MRSDDVVVPVGKHPDGHIIYNCKFAEPHRDEVPNVSLHFVKGTGKLYYLEPDKTIRCYPVKAGDVLEGWEFQSILHWFVSDTKDGVDFYRVLEDGGVEPQIYFQDFIEQVTKDKT